MVAGVVVDACEEECDIAFYAVVLGYGGEEGFCVEAVDVVEVVDVAGEVAPSEVGAGCEGYEVDKVVRECDAGVGVLLDVLVVDVHCGGVLGGVLEVVEVVVGVFGVEPEVGVGEEGLVGELSEEVLVPLSVVGVVLFGESSDDWSWQTTLGVVVVGVAFEVVPESGGFDAEEGYVAVVTSSGGVFVFGVEGELVVAVGVLPFAVEEGVVGQSGVGFEFVEAEGAMGVFCLEGVASGGFCLKVDGGS